MSLARTEPEQPEDVQFDEAELVMQIMQERYEATEKILKKYRLNWTQYREMKNRIAEAFPGEGMNREGYRFVVNRQPVRVYRAEQVETIGEKSTLSIHKGGKNV
jgi:hypothetical protein